MTKIDVNALREYLRDYVGTAMMSGYSAVRIEQKEVLPWASPCGASPSATSPAKG